MKPLTGQQKQVYDYLKAHSHATIREIRDNTFPSVQKPCMRLAEMERLGVDVQRHGRNKHREMLYSIGTPLTKQVQKIEIRDGVAYRSYENVNV